MLSPFAFLVLVEPEPHAFGQEAGEGASDEEVRKKIAQVFPESGRMNDHLRQSNQYRCSTRQQPSDKAVQQSRGEDDQVALTQEWALRSARIVGDYRHKEEVQCEQHSHRRSVEADPMHHKKRAQVVDPKQQEHKHGLSRQRLPGQQEECLNRLGAHQQPSSPDEKGPDGAWQIGFRGHFATAWAAASYSR